jgi:energy-converting hydrogenase Eha subunit F
MTRSKISPTLTFTACLVLTLSLLGGLTFTREVAASVEQTAKSDKISPSLRGHVSAGSGETVSVILQLNGVASGRLNALLNRNGIHIKQLFKNFNSSVVELPANVVDELAAYDEVSFVSLDDQIISMGHVSSTTGADDVRTQSTEQAWL